MSTKYKESKDVPTEELCKRAEQLGYAVTKGSKIILREFDMRVPVEFDRDADMVILEIVKRLRQACAESS